MGHQQASCRSSGGHPPTRWVGRVAAEDYGELRIFKRRICDLIAEVTSDVTRDQPCTNILIYCPSRGLRLVLEAAQECANDTLLKVRAWILGDDLPSQLSRKLVITLSQNVQSYAGIEKRGFRLFVLCYSGRGVQSDGIPGRLNRGLWQLVMRKKLACGVGADHFKAIGSTIVLLDEAEIMESGAYEKQFGVVLQPCGISLGGGEKEHAVGMVEEQFGTVLAKQARCFPRQDAVGNACLNTVALKCGTDCR